MIKVRRNYLILILLGLVFLAPGLGAYLFYTHQRWLSSAPTNKGLLLNPPLLLTNFASSHKKHWKLILWSTGACEKKCIQQLDKLARIRLALGRHLYDVALVLVLGTPALPDDALAQSLREEDIRVVNWPHDASFPAKEPIKIFIANPDNYLVLSYRAGVHPNDIVHDMKQLLQ